MSDKPKIYARCKAGCLWEVPHIDDVMTADKLNEVKADVSDINRTLDENVRKISDARSMSIFSTNNVVYVNDYTGTEHSLNLHSMLGSRNFQDTVGVTLDLTLASDSGVVRYVYGVTCFWDTLIKSDVGANCVKGYIHGFAVSYQETGYGGITAGSLIASVKLDELCNLSIDNAWFTNSGPSNFNLKQISVSRVNILK